jgi:hypothetical protein
VAHLTTVGALALRSLLLFAHRSGGVAVGRDGHTVRADLGCVFVLLSLLAAGFIGLELLESLLYAVATLVHDRKMGSIPGCLAIS